MKQKMECPGCKRLGKKTDPRNIVKDGPAYRKGGPVQKYRCTVCGETGRGSKFGLEKERKYRPRRKKK